VKQGRHEARQPIFEVLRRYPKEVLVAMGARFAENGAFYLYTVFVLVYAVQHVHMDRNIVLTALIIAATLELAAIPLYGALSDRIGRRPVYLFGAVCTALSAYPIFWMLDTGQPWLVRLALMLGLLTGHAAMYAPQGAFFAELFGTRVRYSGASLGVQLSSVLAGGLSPLIAAGLLQFGYGRGALSLYLMGMALVTIVSVFVATETMHHDIDQADYAATHSRKPTI
jgi:MFS family permease